MSSWNKAKTQSKSGFDKVWEWSLKLGGPVNKLTHKLGSEAFFPTTLDKESDKAARILRSFCKDGFYTQPDKKAGGAAATDGPKGKQRVLVKIPQRVIQNCVGLVIYTTMRTGMWISGAGGSGVLIARKPDGSWSPPSGLLVHTLGVGFMAGIDIYDTVLVINNHAALDAFTKLRVSLGGEVSVVAGPLGAGGVVDAGVKNGKPVYAYIKSRGLYAGVQVDGTIILERNDENAAFYGRKVTTKEILNGDVQAPPSTRLLMETLKQAEGRTDLDYGVLQSAANDLAPGDMEVDMKPTQEQQAQFAPPPDAGSAYYAPPQHDYQSHLQNDYYTPPDGAYQSHPQNDYYAAPQGGYSAPREPDHDQQDAPSYPPRPGSSEKYDPDGPPRYSK